MLDAEGVVGVAELRFQVGDYVLVWGQIGRVIGVTKRDVVVERTKPVRECVAYGRQWLADQQRGYWEGRPIPPSRPGPKPWDGYTWSHRGIHETPAP